MADTTNNTAQQRFQNNIEMKLQVMKDPLEEALVITSDASAELVKVRDIFGNKDMQEDDETGGDTDWTKTPWDGVWVAKPNELYTAEIIENADQLMTAIDLGGAAVEEGAAVIQRARIRRTLEGFYGDIVSGKKATVSTAFPAGNYIAVDTGAAAATKMNTAKIRAALKFLLQQYVDPTLQRWMILTADDNDALLTEVPVTSEDFKRTFSAEVNDQGMLTRMLGFRFIHLELDNTLLKTIPGLATDANSYRLNPFWVKGGLVRNDWQRVRTEVGKIPQKRFMPGHLAGTTCAATRTQPGMSGIIRNVKG